MSNLIKKDIEKIYIKAVKKDGMHLEFCLVQTPKICLAAVKQNGLALQFVEDQTLLICKMSVAENIKAFKYAEFQTVGMCKRAIDINEMYILFCNYLTPSMCYSVLIKNEIRKRQMIIKLNEYEYLEFLSKRKCLYKLFDRLSADLTNKLTKEFPSLLQYI